MQFIDTIAQYLIQEEKGSFEDICLLVPGKRAGMYLHQSLMRKLQKPAWGPQIMTINELFLSLSKYQKADSLQLIYELFLVFRKIKKSNESFNNFYYWGEVMLNDFEDIDKYRVNASQIFSNIKNIKDIENLFDVLTEEQIQSIEKFWNHFNTSKISKQKEDFIAVWDILGEVYHSYQEHLQKKDLCYEGMAFREIASRADEMQINIPFKKVYCIGFNILNECEHALFRYLKKSGKGIFFWDYDPYYLTEGHEAGRFIRTNLSLYPPPEHADIYNNLSGYSPKKPKEIYCMGCLTNTSQVKLLPHILEKFGITKQKNFENTAIVLCDEKLLIPIMQSIPENIEYNITMGYPFEQTPLYSFLNTFFDLHKSIKIIKNKPCYYYKHVLSILSHQYIMPIERKSIEDIITNIHQNNRVYLHPEDIEGHPILNMIFKIPDNHMALLTQIRELIKLLYQHMGDIEKTSLDQEYLYMQYKQFNRFSIIANKINDLSPLDLSVLKQLFFQSMANLRIPFTGEPIKGIQIMGLLETRALDFDKVLILSANEGYLPKTTASPSFIPYNLRKGFSLQTIEYQDSIYAYYFYRLLQRTKETGITFSQESKSLGSNEQSRFLTQLKYDKRFSLITEQQSYTINPVFQKEISIQKDNAVMEKLLDFSRNRNLSASSLITYMGCPLQFFFRYIAKLEASEEVSEEIDPAETGSIIHKTIESLYKGYREVTKEDIKKIIANKKLMQSTVFHYYMEEHKIKDRENAVSGNNMLSLAIIENAVIQILEHDKNNSPFDIVSLEKEISFSRDILTESKYTSVNFKGYIDRIDVKDGIVRIIDYKSGKADLSFKEIEELFAEDNQKRKNAIFQLVFYTQAILDEFKGREIRPAVYSLKNLYDQSFDPFIKMNKKYLQIEDIMHVFNEELTKKLQSLFDAETPFYQTSVTENCSYCDYKAICNR